MPLVNFGHAGPDQESNTVVITLLGRHQRADQPRLVKGQFNRAGLKEHRIDADRFAQAFEQGLRECVMGCVLFV